MSFAVSVVFPICMLPFDIGSVLESLESALAQTIDVTECLLVGSPEAAETLLRHFGDDRLRLVKYEGDNKYVAIDVGLKSAESPYIAVQDPESVSLPHRLARQVKAAAMNQHLGVLGAGVGYWERDGRVYASSYFPSGANKVKDFLFFGVPVAWESLLVRRDVVEKVQGLRAAHDGSCIYDFIIRVSEVAQIDNVPEVLVVRKNKGVKTDDRIELERLRQKYVEKFTHSRVDYQRKIFELLCVRPRDKVLGAYFVQTGEAYRERGGLKDFSDRATNLKLEYVHGNDKWRAALELSEFYYDEGKKRLSFMCLVDSLAKNPAQSQGWEILKKRAGEFERAFSQREPLSFTQPVCTVSVIIRTVGNRPRELETAIRSVLNQTFPDFEVIVVDDSGKEAARPVVESISSDAVRYLANSENLGPSQAWNSGLKACRGKYIGVLDDDDIYYPWHLEVLVKALEANKQVGLVYGTVPRVYGTRSNGEFVEYYRVRKPEEEWTYSYEKLKRSNFIPVNAILFRRSLVQRSGLVNSELPCMEDWEFFLRLARECEFLHVPKDVAEYRWKNDNASYNRINMLVMSQLINKYYNDIARDVAWLSVYLICGDKDRAMKFCADLNTKYDKELINRGGLLRSLFDILMSSTIQLRNEFVGTVMSENILSDPFKCFKELVQKRRAHLLRFALLPLLKRVLSFHSRPT
ncbi:Glycosyltransferase, GT2 family [Desulfacinum infernum DSM 9756]|uniref:Glycosyltransferase, GT2 family n=1 Tax=Desulfacinum infernum DSM 9756 TaxID=1121391 RepID=A0A1M5HWX3_9BACT|nr:glycosyltransferase [Desulfacinum infernum]SHG20481.1 Glycosyltransferase, GT2 family [Desulfacinum infernum DSM 9756]